MCAASVVVVPDAVASVVICAKEVVEGNEGFATTQDIAGAVVDICCRVVVNAASI